VARSYNNLEFQFHRVETSSADTIIDLTTVLQTHKDATAEDRIKAVEDHITTAYTSTNSPSKESKEAISSLATWALTPELGATSTQLQSISFSQIQLLEEFLKNTRKYNFDLSPKLLYSRGPLTNLLISSGIGKYLEFKLLERTAVYEALTDKVEMMPTSKEDVFVSKALSLKEKRLLMKFLQFAVDYENQKEVWEGSFTCLFVCVCVFLVLIIRRMIPVNEFFLNPASCIATDYKNAPFTQFVQSAYGLTDKVLTAVVYAIGFDGNDYGKEFEEDQVCVPWKP
jgi:hypothetical protein